MDCVELVPRNGLLILGALALIGWVGVGFHVWWSSRLTFFKFDQQDTTNKGNFKRLLYPLIPVSILALLTPVVAVIAFPEFRGCLEDPSITGYLSKIWLYLLPVVGTWIGASAVVCIFIAMAAYWLFGMIIYLIARARG
jgi:hypothetical protein